ncbi:MAG TPA: M48 family metalloprotease [Candidatus Binatia bacterium]|jgi:predicted Zn-dependent protease
MVRRSLFLLLLSIVAASCAPAALPPIDSSKAFQAEADEKKLWDESEAFRRRLEKAGLVYEDQELENYLNSVAARLLGNRLQGTNVLPKVKVVKDPFLNAFALPDGSIYFHTGLLARMENEAQLATVLGHEIAHFINRDSARQLRYTENRQTTARVLQTVLVLSVFGVFADKLPDVWASASVTGYSKEIENEADGTGLNLMVAAGYDPKESLKAFDLLKQDWEEGKVKEPFFYGTPLLIEDRVENMSRLVNGVYQKEAVQAARLVNSESFSTEMQRVLLENALLDMNLGRMRLAEAVVEKHLRREPDSARGHFTRGEVFRRMGRLEDAAAEYVRAAALDSGYADPHRELGLLYRAQSRSNESRAEFEKYLALSPKALDAPIIRGYLQDAETP